MSIQGFEHWLQTPAGRYVLDWEQRTHDALVTDIFGFNALQLTLPMHDFLRANRMPLRFRCDDGRSVALINVQSDLHHLPFAANSVDLVVMPHAREFDDNPHQVLREVERVLVPEGQVIISGFNPFSLWGWRRKFSRQPAPAPWRGSYISLPRLRDWFSLLGLELQDSRFGCYAPPFDQQKWLQRFGWMEKVGRRSWSPAGAVYIAHAIKRQHSLRLITPKWHDRKALAKALATVTQRREQ